MRRRCDMLSCVGLHEFATTCGRGHCCRGTLCSVRFSSLGFHLARFRLRAVVWDYRGQGEAAARHAVACRSSRFRDSVWHWPLLSRSALLRPLLHAGTSPGPQAQIQGKARRSVCGGRGLRLESQNVASSGTTCRRQQTPAALNNDVLLVMPSFVYPCLRECSSLLRAADAQPTSLLVLQIIGSFAVMAASV